jgi:hypothetical protein
MAATAPATETFINISAHLPIHDYDLEIIGPTGVPTGWKWTLAASNHPKNTAYVEAEASRQLEKAKVLKEADYAGRRYEAELLTPDQSRREAVQWIVARTLNFTPVKLSPDADVIHFSDKNAEDLLIRPEFDFLAAQVVKALRDDARFTQRSAKA